MVAARAKLWGRNASGTPAHMKTPLALLAAAALVACGSDDPLPYAAPETGTDTAVDAPADTTDALAGDADAADATADTPDTTDAPDVEFVSQLRLVHLSPDTPALDLYLDGEPVLTNIEPFSVAPEGGIDESYLTVETGNYQAALVPVGGTLDDAVLTETWRLSEFAVYSVTIAGLSGLEAEPPEGAEPLQLVVTADDTGVLEDEFENPLAQLRFFHVAPGVGPLDFVIEDTAVDQGTVFGAFTPDEYILPTVEIQLGFRQAGAEELLVAATVPLGGGTTYAWAGGSVSDGGFWLVTVDPKNDLVRYE